jgi:hypothetical protein
VAAVGGISPALAAGLDPADYPVVPGGVPQAWERAQVYLGLCERYQELYQTQVAELHLLMTAMPASSLPLPQHRPLTDPPTGTRTTATSLTPSRHAQPGKTLTTRTERRFGAQPKRSSEGRAAGHAGGSRSHLSYGSVSV